MDTVEIQSGGSNKPRSKAAIIVAAAIALVVVAGLVVWGVFTHNRNQEIGRWQEAAETLAEAITAAQIVDASSVGAIADAEGVDVEKSILENAVTAQAALRDGIDQALADFDEIFIASEPDEPAQSGGAQSGGEQIVTVSVYVDPDTASARNDEETALMRASTESLGVMSESASTTGAALADETHTVLLAQAQESYVKAVSGLEKGLKDANALLKSSDGQVADSKTRDDLKSVVDAAQAVYDKNLEPTSTIEELDSQSAAMIDATKSLGAPVKAVKDSVAKKEADDAAAEASRQAEMARQAQAQVSSGGGYSSGGNSWSGNSGYSSGGNSWSGNSGGSGSNNSGWSGGMYVTGPPITDLDDGGTYCQELAAAGGSCIG